MFDFLSSLGNVSDIFELGFMIFLVKDNVKKIKISDGIDSEEIEAGKKIVSLLKNKIK